MINWPMAICYCITVLCLSNVLTAYVNRNKPVEVIKEDWRTRTTGDDI